MKNLSYILNGILAVALIVVYLLLKGDIKDLSENPAPAKAKASLAGVQGSSNLSIDTADVAGFPSTDIVYISVDSLLLQYHQYNEVVVPLERKMQNAETEYKRQMQAIQQEYMTENQQYQQGFKTSAAMEETARKLEQKGTALETKFQGQANELSQQYSVALEKVQTDIRTYLNNLAAAKGYKYIINGATVLYGVQTSNITEETLVDLNVRYAASK